MSQDEYIKSKKPLPEFILEQLSSVDMQRTDSLKFYIKTLHAASYNMAHEKFDVAFRDAIKELKDKWYIRETSVDASDLTFAITELGEKALHRETIPISSAPIHSAPIDSTEMPKNVELTENMPVNKKAVEFLEDNALINRSGNSIKLTGYGQTVLGAIKVLPELAKSDPHLATVLGRIGCFNLSTQGTAKTA